MSSGSSSQPDRASVTVPHALDLERPGDAVVGGLDLRRAGRSQIVAEMVLTIDRATLVEIGAPVGEVGHHLRVAHLWI